MAIKPKYAYYIKHGIKTIELRKLAPKANPGDVLVIYESAPISKITSYGTIKKILKMPPKELWKLTASKTMVDEKSYYEYFCHKKTAYGIVVNDIKVLEVAKDLSCISKKYAPQNYCYITNDEFKLLM